MRLPALLLIALCVGVPAAAQQTRLQKELAGYEAADRTAAPPKGAIVFVGSSTIVNWDTATAFPELRTINRGLWGSTLGDVNRHIDRLVLSHAPRLVVVYAGDNDVNAFQTSEMVAVEFERLVRAVHTRLPQTRIVFIGIKPSPQRWIQIDRMRMANDIVRRFCERDDRLAFLDVDGAMLGWDEKPRRELFVEDGLHLSLQGYQLWNILLRPFLVP